MRLTLRHEYLPSDLDGALFVSPLREDAKNIYNAGGGIDAAAPATQVVDALGSFIHPDTGLITPATANVLRVGAGTDYVSRIRGALFEAARTNSCLQSEDFSTTWAKFNASISADAAAAPDGTLTADKLVEASDTNKAHRVDQTISVTSGQKVCFSVFVKSAGRHEMRIDAFGSGSPASTLLWFDVDAGTVGSAGAGIDNSGVDDMKNGWKRCWFVFTAAATDTVTFQTYIVKAGEVVSYDGDGSSGLYLWGAQCEENVPFPGSYIKTTTAPVTRAADDIRFDNTAGVNVAAAEGTFYFAYTSQGEPGGNNRLIDLVKTGPNNGWKIYSGTSGLGNAEVWNGGAAVADLALGQIETRGTTFVICLVWKLNDFRVYVDGVEKASDTSGAAPADISATIFIGQDSAAANQSNAQFAHLHSYSTAHDAARALANTNEIKSWLGL